MPRHAIGIIAVLLLAGGVALRIWPPGFPYEICEGACWRLGPAAALVWLAYPELHRGPVWLLLLLPVLLVLVVWRPKLILVFIPALFILWFLWFLKQPIRPQR